MLNVIRIYMTSDSEIMGKRMTAGGQEKFCQHQDLNLSLQDLKGLKIVHRITILWPKCDNP